MNNSMSIAFTGIILGLSISAQALPPMRTNPFVYSDFAHEETANTESSNTQQNNSTNGYEISHQTNDSSQWKIVSSTHNSLIIQDAAGNTREIKID